MKPSIYGKYPGKLKNDTNYIQNCSEIELFIQVNKYYGLFQTIEYYSKMKKFYQITEDEKMMNYFEELRKQELEKSNLLKNEPQEFLYTMNYCLLQTSRFDTKIVYNPKGQVEITKEFQQWYQNWLTYFQNMSMEDLMIYRKCSYEGKNLQYFQLNREISTKDILENPENKNSYQLVKKNIRQTA